MHTATLQRGRGGWKFILLILALPESARRVKARLLGEAKPLVNDHEFLIDSSLVGDWFDFVEGIPSPSPRAREFTTGERKVSIPVTLSNRMIVSPRHEAVQLRHRARVLR